MEPGDYLTNVLSFNNYVSVGYEYFEVERLSSGIAKRHLQRLELGWRQEGKLVHYDTFREGLWVFHSSPNASTSSPMKDIESASSSVEVRAVGLVQRDKGTYEPASLVRSKSTIPNTMSTPSSSSSPSSSLENSLRNAQTLNARSIQTNSALGMPHEPGTLSPGVKSAVSSELSASLKDIHEYFISAVLSSLVYFLCRHQNYIPLNSRTLILAAPTPTDALNATYRSSQIMTPIELATLDISLTSLGALVVKAHSDFAPGLQSLADWSTPANNDELNVGASLWLAPSGNAAKFHSTLDESTVGGPLSMLQFQSNTTDLPSNALNTSTIKSWQSKCLDWLSAKGLNAALLDSGGWLYVQIIGGSPYLNPENQNTLTSEELAIVPWPALLCFQASGTTSRDLQQLGVAGTVSRDPLAFAEDWFNSRDERANSMLKRQKDRQAAEAVSREQADSDARALQSHIFSPATLRRGSNAGAMYPTPPDAPHPVGATPNFDGNVSTPGNQTSFAPPDSGSAPITTNTGVTDVDVDMWTSAKKERNGSAVQFTDNGAETDHLYGDSLDADMFGTDIIEADFDFFDVPDSVPHEDRVSTPTTPNLPIAVQTTHGQNPPESNAYGDTDIVEPEEDNYRELMHEPTTIIPVEELVDDPMELGTATQKDVNAECSNSQVQTSRERSPFTKETVFHRLSQRYNSGKCGPQSRRSSLFNKITFEDSVISVNAKYAAHGQFNFSIQKKKPALEWPIELPQTSYLRGRRKARDSKQISGFTPHIVVEKAPVDRISTEPMDYLIDSDAASQVSEQDDTSHTTDEPSPNSKLGVKRRWDADDGDDINSSFDALAMDLEHAVGTPQSISGSQLPMLDADPADWSLATYFTSPEPDVQSYLLSDPERIATAQILADQAVSGVFYTPGSMVSDNDSKRERVSTTRELMHCLARAAKSCLKDFNVCTMRSFLDIQGIPVLNQGLRLPPRPVAPRGPNGLEPARPNNPFLLPPPQLEVRRSDTKLTILPPAVNFWENLGLGPAQGVKDINAVCVYPNIDGAAINAGIFLDQMRSVYESSRFGNHNRASSKEVALGLLSYSLDPLQQHRQQYATALKETTAQLCRILQSLTVGETNFVVYFVYPNENGPLLVQICSAFQHLFYLYKKALSERRINMVNELVLQLIPLEFITSPTTLSMPLPSDYFHLSMEVYDRCIDFTSSSSSPAIMLERPLPKNIDFKLSSNPSASVLQENTCLHVAYAQSIDDRWVTAAWTDNRGTQQMTASYCLGRKNEPLSMPFSQIASEIWETTIDYVAGKKIHWRLMVAKVGVMEPSELEVWTGLASNETRAQVSLTLITVHTDPSLRLLPAATVLTPTGAATSSVITPVSTPQALQSSIVSPETANTPTRENANAVTAAEAPVEPDGDSRLVDLTDQSWGAVLGHRLNNSNSLLELNLALISGYLVKRGGMNSDDAPIVMEVNIVHSDVIGNPRTFHESLLREVLNYYRGLGSLARVRGVVDSVVDLRPWHIAAAEKAVKALYMLM